MNLFDFLKDQHYALFIGALLLQNWNLILWYGMHYNWKNNIEAFSDYTPICIQIGKNNMEAFIYSYIYFAIAINCNFYNLCISNKNMYCICIKQTVQCEWLTVHLLSVSSFVHALICINILKCSTAAKSSIPFPERLGSNDRPAVLSRDFIVIKKQICNQKQNWRYQNN